MSAPQPSPRAPVTSSARLAALHVVVLALLGLGALMTAPGAAAHDSLISANPGQDDVVQDVPAEVILTFSAEILDLPTSMVVTGPDGDVVVEGAPTIDGQSVILDLPASLENGTYEVMWSVVSSDGHRAEDRYAFTVTAAGPSGGMEPTAGGAASETSVPEPPGDSGTSAPPEVESSARPAPGMPTWGTILIVQAGILGFAVAAALAYRRWYQR